MEEFPSVEEMLRMAREKAPGMMWEFTVYGTHKDGSGEISYSRSMKVTVDEMLEVLRRRAAP